MDKDIKKPSASVVIKNHADQPVQPESLVELINKAVQIAVKTALAEKEAAQVSIKPNIQAQQVQVAPPAQPKSQGYVSRLKGIEVEPGQDIRHVPREKIQAWFSAIEQRWKESYNKNRAGEGASSMSLSRG